MLDKRYQVFISMSGSEMQPERIVLAQTLVGMGFFSWGLGTFGGDVKRKAQAQKARLIIAMRHQGFGICTSYIPIFQLNG